MGFPEKLVGSLESTVGSHESIVPKGFPYSSRLTALPVKAWPVLKLCLVDKRYHLIRN